jgi:hypothetical protein
MYGATINRLSLLLTESGKEDIVVWSLSGSQGRNWLSFTENVTITSMNQMVSSLRQN